MDLFTEQPRGAAVRAARLRELNPLSSGITPKAEMNHLRASLEFLSLIGNPEDMSVLGPLPRKPQRAALYTEKTAREERNAPATSRPFEMKPRDSLLASVSIRLAIAALGCGC